MHQCALPLADRLCRFHLALHPDKTRLLECGRFASANRERRGQTQAGDLRIPGFHPLLWEDAARWFYGLASDVGET